METVEIHDVPIFDGLPFPIALAMLTVRPNEDCAFPWGIAADVLYDDPVTGKQHAIPEARANRILADIRRNDGETWAQIERAARLNSRPDHDEPDYDREFELEHNSMEFAR